jgi:M-phase inducer tyrosine phosphatase
MRNMEHSSPLAAMQPPAPLIFGRCFRSEAAGSYSMVPPARKLGAESFNFKELSMSRFHADYFSAKPVGSSPTASLAADLSQNFHIDQRFVSHLHPCLLFLLSCNTRTGLQSVLLMLILTRTVYGSPQLVTPRRSLFSANLFGSENGRGKPNSLCLLCAFIETNQS